MKPLTARELEVVALIAQGKRSYEVSSILGISQHTVRAHKRNIFAKTGTDNVVKLALWYLKNNRKVALTSSTRSG
jgi:DNA-binding CsgD family transcriptional regulator